MRFGTAKNIITPYAPMYIACNGTFDRNFSKIHDDVYVRCLVLDDGSSKAVLMSFDLLFHDRLLNDAIAAYANEKYGIDSAAVVVSYTHAHPTPASRGYNLNHHNEDYEVFLERQAKICLDRALCSMEEGSFAYGCFDADFNVSRRGNKAGVFDNIPDFDYPRDREFWVLYIRDTEENIRSIVTNYACHPVFYPIKDGISSEFPGRLCQLLDTKYYGCISLFFQSAAGDVRPRSTADMEAMERGDPWPWKKNTFADVAKMAQDMCDAVSSFVENGGCKAACLSIKADAFAIPLPMDGRPRSYFEEQMRKMEEAPDGPDRTHAFYIAQGGYDALEDVLMLHCQTVRLTRELYLATVGGEPCFGVKNAVKKAFPPDKDVCFMGYTDACAYIVDDRVLAEGGYEPTSHLEYCLKGPFQPGLDARYIEGFSNSLKRIEE